MKQTFIIVIHSDEPVTEAQIGVAVMDKLNLPKVVVVKEVDTVEVVKIGELDK